MCQVLVQVRSTTQRLAPFPEPHVSFLKVKHGFASNSKVENNERTAINPTIWVQRRNMNVNMKHKCLIVPDFGRWILIPKALFLLVYLFDLPFTILWRYFYEVNILVRPWFGCLLSLRSKLLLHKLHFIVLIRIDFFVSFFESFLFLPDVISRIRWFYSSILLVLSVWIPLLSVQYRLIVSRFCVVFFLHVYSSMRLHYPFIPIRNWA